MNNKILSQLDQMENLVKNLVSENLKHHSSAKKAYTYTDLDKFVERKATKKELAIRGQVWSKLYTLFEHTNLSELQTKKLQSKLGFEPNFSLDKTAARIVTNIKKSGINESLHVDGVLKVGAEEE